MRRRKKKKIGTKKDYSLLHQSKETAGI